MGYKKSRWACFEETWKRKLGKVRETRKRKHFLKEKEEWKNKTKPIMCTFFFFFFFFFFKEYNILKRNEINPTFIRLKYSFFFFSFFFFCFFKVFQSTKYIVHLSASDLDRRLCKSLCTVFFPSKKKKKKKLLLPNYYLLHQI